MICTYSRQSEPQPLSQTIVLFEGEWENI